MSTQQENPKERIVWLFEHYAVPPSMSGFVRQYDHARYMANKGWKGRVFTSSYNHKTHVYERPTTLTKPVYDTMEGDVDFTWVYTAPYTRNNWKRYLNMVSYWANSLVAGFGKRERPHIVLGASPHLLAAFSAWITARRFRVPFVLEIQDLWPESLVQLGLNNKQIIWVLEKLERLLYRNADAVVTLTDGISEGVARKSGPGKKIVRIQNGATVVPQIEPSVREQQRKDRGWQNKWVVMWAGAHARANSIDTIIEAARINSQDPESVVHYVFVGDGPDKKELIQLAKGLPNTEFLDPVPSDEVGDLLQLADAGVIVYKDADVVRGARPTKLTTYMGSHLPILNNIQGECASIIQEAECGTTVPPEDPEALAEAAKFASMNPDVYTQMGMNSSAFLKATHDRETLAYELADLLESLVRSRK